MSERGDGRELCTCDRTGLSDPGSPGESPGNGEHQGEATQRKVWKQVYSAGVNLSGFIFCHWAAQCRIPTAMSKDSLQWRKASVIELGSIIAKMTSGFAFSKENVSLHR